MMTLREMIAVLLDEVTAGLDEVDMLDNMCVVTAFPGNAVPVDYVGSDESCGSMAWVRHISSYPSVRFPSSDLSLENCHSTLAHIMEVGIMRPAPLPESDGTTVELPDDLEHLNTAFDLADDMMVMRNAIVRAGKTIDFVILGSYTPLGPEGGSVGGTWQVTVGDDDDGGI